MFQCWPSGTHSNRFYAVVVVCCLVCLSVVFFFFCWWGGGFYLFVCLLACSLLFLYFFPSFRGDRQVLLVPNFKEAAECISQATTPHGDLYTQTPLPSLAELRLQTE